MKITHLSLFVVTCFVVSSCDWGDFESVLVTPHYSIFYSEDFARRFSLPVDKAVKLNDVHLKAVAIGIQKINRNYECNIHLYFDNTIKLYSPNRQKTFFKTSDKEGFFVKKYNKFDLQYNYKNVSNNITSALFLSKSLRIAQKGIMATIGYASYKEQILPNLNMVSLDIPCISLDVRNGEAEVWIKKVGMVNYDLINEDPLNIKHPENNYRFDIPLDLLQSVKPMIDRINALPVDLASSNVSVQYGVRE